MVPDDRGSPGGCAIALVKDLQVKDFIAAVDKEYLKKRIGCNDLHNAGSGWNQFRGTPGSGTLEGFRFPDITDTQRLSQLQHPGSSPRKHS